MCGECPAVAGAIRCYRHALELDLADREVLERIVETPVRARAPGWPEYLAALDPRWRYPARHARVVIGAGATIECPPVGAVLRLAMPSADEIVVESFAAMPTAMAMIIVRRAMWPTRIAGVENRTLVVRFGGRAVVLDEYGDWQPIFPGTGGPVRDDATPARNTRVVGAV